MKIPRVMLANDHPMVVEAFRKLLEDRREIVGTVTDGHALLQAAPKLQPEVQIPHHNFTRVGIVRVSDYLTCTSIGYLIGYRGQRGQSKAEQAQVLEGNSRDAFNRGTFVHISLGGVGA